MEKDTNTSKILAVFQPPANQDERVKATSLGLVSITASVGIFLLNGISSLAIPGLLIAAVLGAMAYWIQHKYPKWKSIAAVVAGVAGLSFLNIIPGIQAVSSFIMGAAGVLSAGFGLWKIGSAVYSIFKKNR
ncbi:hypothetical protein [Salinispira pacifica]|uniref:Uncharacterized protein n=1 Tax=Salinispira pacifica TaxID=1307761 RepID=V5WHX9_9SPIO|nr:hypothetical protein [Salinispira pacifica]AHC15225.1 hypothetical protein L21SP2_1850 [Salinispira pacifica]